jgi:hypothetical protein
VAVLQHSSLRVLSQCDRGRAAEPAALDSTHGCFARLVHAGAGDALRRIDTVDCAARVTPAASTRAYQSLLAACGAQSVSTGAATSALTLPSLCEHDRQLCARRLALLAEPTLDTADAPLPAYHTLLPSEQTACDATARSECTCTSVRALTCAVKS